MLSDTLIFKVMNKLSVARLEDEVVKLYTKYLKYRFDLLVGTI